jgi:hypothetical protein
VIKANEPLSWALVVSALTLQIVETIAFQGSSDHLQEESFNPDLLNTKMVSIQDIVIKTLLVQPLAQGPWLRRSCNRDISR